MHNCSVDRSYHPPCYRCGGRDERILPCGGTRYLLSYGVMTGPGSPIGGSKLLACMSLNIRPN